MAEEIRLSNTSYVVLGLIELLGESTPYELKQAMEKSVENFWPIPHTTFYEEPARLARGGHLTERQEEGGRRRKRYALTGRGREALREWVASSEISAPQLRDEGILKIFFGAELEPILRQRRDWHRAKLTELEAYMAAVSESGGPAGVLASLVAGTTYNRVLAEEYEKALADLESEEPGEASAPGRARPAE